MTRTSQLYFPSVQIDVGGDALVVIVCGDADAGLRRRGSPVAFGGGSAVDCRALVFRGFAAAVAPYALLSTSSCPLVVRAAAAVPVARANPVHAEALVARVSAVPAALAATAIPVARVSAVPAALAATAIPVARALHAFIVQFLSQGAAAAAHA
ncbi:hypothetical protein SAY87_023207 [Trapa incisa]|uniref:Uncharacterized protein n=1 Tax=Trapa incisa TaxID=236973 RepID=A0AAN7K516_9MYRT|nr:hypothetical protein SAY87_023207 [Trapa incisa]